MKVTFGLLLSFFSSASFAEQITVAVAANFAAPTKALIQAYKKHSKDNVQLVLGSTGKLYAQIIHGAPYDAFFAADQQRPTLLAQQLNKTSFSYAIGRLAVVPDVDLTTLRLEHKEKIAIANPALAPYGVAAEQALTAFKPAEYWRQHLVLAENANQALHFFHSGNAAYALLSLSQAQQAQLPYRLIDSQLHQPIVQNAIALTAAGERFCIFVKSAVAQQLIQGFGYSLPAPQGG